MSDSMDRDGILLDHGSGGKLSLRLLKDRIAPRLGLRGAELLDAAAVEIGGREVAFTTDSFVVQPPFFPGGSIGTLAVCGTVNDLAVSGARPVALSCSLILEAGVSLKLVERVLDDIAHAAIECNVRIVTGDTKVVEHGSADAIFVNTAGIGEYVTDEKPHPERIAAGDAILVSGPIGDHGVAVMLERSGAELRADVQSDCMGVWPLVEAALDSGAHVHAMRDPTRGGVATVLNEWAQDRPWGICVDESALPVRPAVANVCDVLGLDSLYVACEGRILLACPEPDAGRVLDAWRCVPHGDDAAVIAHVSDKHAGQVSLRTRIGGLRRLDMLTGAQLPRIC